MKVLNKKVFILSILLLFPVLICAQSRLIKRGTVPVKKTVVVELESKAKHYVGVCPVTIKMTGKITASAPMTVRYNFVRSDGITTRGNVLKFMSKGTKSISFKWALNKNGQAWVRFVVKTESGKVKEAKQEFEVTCNNLNQVGQADFSLKKIQKPDLTISGISFLNGTPKVNKANEFLIGVKNISRFRGKPSPPCHITVQIFVGIQLELFESFPVPEIPSGVNKVVPVPFTFTQPGKWRIEAWVDGKKEVKELDEKNNTKSLSFQILLP